MKASTRKRLEALEQAASTRAVRPIVIIEVLTMTEADREAYWAGDQEMLRRYGSPDPAEVPSGQIHTIVVNLHPGTRDPRLTPADLQNEGIGE